MLFLFWQVCSTPTVVPRREPGHMWTEGAKPMLAASTSNTAKTRVAYGTTKYPSLTNISYDTFRKLDYQEKNSTA